MFRWYRQLREVEDGDRQAAERPSCCASSTAIEKRVEQVTVPLSYADELYALRTHIQMVGRAADRPGGPATAVAEARR